MSRPTLHKTLVFLSAGLLLSLGGLAAFVMLDTISAARAAGVDTISVQAVVIVGLLGLALACAAVFSLHRLVFSGPLALFAQSLNATIQSRDYSQGVVQTGIPAVDAIGTGVSRLLETVKQRDETIERHEQMERNLEDWLKKRRAHELELQEARLAAEDANMTKSHFLASVSHELRTPLHTILSYARFGVRDAEDDRYDDAAEHFEVILDSADLLLLLLNDLLDLSKLESGKLSFNPTPTSFGDIIGCVVDQFQLSVKQKQIEVVTNVREPDVILVDASRTVQVVRNLFENAFKYSHSRSSIFVDVSTHDGEVTLTVRDQGPGVPEDELSTIFESFRQSSKTNAAAGGVGLGLAIARQIVASQRGKIWADNHPDGGLAVSVQFPAYEVDSSSGEEVPVAFEESRLE